MNSLTDPVLIHALIVAGQKGAQIDLIVRGACMLPAGIPGKTDNIRVRSIIGRFLEHSRVFFFEAGADQDIYLSSADWMTRNMTRRVELAWPVLDLPLRQRIVDECLLAYLHDTRNAWTLSADGKYRRVEKQGHKPQSAQALLMQKYSPAIRKAK
jgi:polyphosphate kinase